MKTFKQHALTEAFTRQHYEAVAKSINKALTFTRNNVSHGEENPGEEAIETLAHDLAETFRADNPRFDKGFFLSKCGL